MDSLLIALLVVQLVFLFALATLLVFGGRYVRLAANVFVRKGDAPMDARHYRFYRAVKHVGARLAEESFLSRLLLVDTARGVQRAIVDVSTRLRQRRSITTPWSLKKVTISVSPKV